MSAPGDWTRHIADIPTVNAHSIEIDAEVNTGRKFVVVDGHGLDLERAAELVIAVNQAMEILSRT